MENEKPELTPEEMACLVDGKGAPAELAELWVKLAQSRESIEEFKEISALVRENHRELPTFVIKRHLDALFPEIPAIWLRIKQKALELVQAPGWNVPAIAYRSDGGNTDAVSLSRDFGSLSVDVRVVRIQADVVDFTVTIQDKTRPGTPTMKVSLLRGDRLVQSKFLEGNQVQFREFKPGEYTVRVDRNREGPLQVGIKVDPK